MPRCLKRVSPTQRLTQQLVISFHVEEERYGSKKVWIRKTKARVVSPTENAKEFKEAIAGRISTRLMVWLMWLDSLLVRPITKIHCYRC